MAGSVNKVILVGNLGRDPEIRQMPNGGAIANLSIATSESWRDRNSGERKEKTEWHRVVIFSDGLVKIAEQYLRKGSTVYIEGQLETRKWQDQSGQDRYTTEIVGNEMQMLDSRGSGGGAGGGGGYDQSYPEASAGFEPSGSAPAPVSPSQPSSGGDYDDDIPF